MSFVRSCITFTPVLFFALSTAGGCAPADDEEEAASGTATSALQAASQGGVTDGVLDDEAPSAPDPSEIAAKAVERPTRGLSPEGCATKTRADNVVTLTLDGCSGPLGKVVMSGELVVTFTRPAPDAIHVDVKGSDDLVANGKPIRYGAQADARWDGSRRRLTYHGESSGETKRGRAFDRATDLAIVADVATRCVEVDGVSKGSVAGWDLDEGFKACEHACPTAGLPARQREQPRGSLRRQRPRPGQGVPRPAVRRPPVVRGRGGRVRRTRVQREELEYTVGRLPPISSYLRLGCARGASPGAEAGEREVTGSARRSA